MTNPTATFAAPQELTPAEAAAVFGGRIQNKITKNATVRQARLKQGKHTVKARAAATNTKQISSASSFSGASGFRI
jgi:hypothetical protein